MSVRRAIGFLLTALVLVLVAPTLIDVYSEVGETFRLPVGWLLVIVGLTAAQFTCTWALLRVVLRTDSWLAVAGPQLGGNLASHVVPMGTAAGAGVQVKMQTTAGTPMGTVITGLSASSLLATAAGFVALPLLVVAATTFGGQVDDTLLAPMWGGTAILAAVLVVLVVMVRRDRPWRAAAGAVVWVQSKRHRVVDRPALEQRFLGERDLLLDTLGDHGPFVALVVVARPLLDYLCLVAALHAVGAEVNPGASLAAYIVSNVAGLIPLTPGGLGFVEAGLQGTLTLAGATSSAAAIAVATYRLASTWLPCLATLPVYVAFRRRFRGRSHEVSIEDELVRPDVEPGGPAQREEPTCPPTPL